MRWLLITGAILISLNAQASMKTDIETLKSSVEQLETKLTECRKEYKSLANQSELQLSKLKEQGVDDRQFKDKKYELQTSLTEKATVCKGIKAELTPKKEKLEVLEIMYKNSPAKIRDDVMAAAKIAPPGEKNGPVIRCFQLGQSFDEFSTCANSLGLNARLDVFRHGVVGLPESYKEVAMTLDKDLIATMDETLHANNLIATGAFFGASKLNDVFIRELMKHYGIKNLKPFTETATLPPTVVSPRYRKVEVDGYKADLDGWSVKIYPGEDIVIFSKTSPTKNLKF